MRPSVRRAGRDQGRPLRDTARREMGLAGRGRHGRYLHLHLDPEGRRGASPRAATLRDHAQILPAADRERHQPVGERAGDAAAEREAESSDPRATIGSIRSLQTTPRVLIYGATLSRGSACMEKFVTLKGIAAHLPMINVDTDMIIPKQYLKTIKRTGLREGLFAELRYD